ncbi:MAG TPA: Ig-like domain-containing protein [Anaerolineae bacterium]|nr:Ig-like domain-containing protein [Anaerolineae bacterium]
MKSISIITIAFIIVLAACAGAGPQAPASVPTVRIDKPLYGASFFEGDVVPVQSASADPNGVTRVELYVDGQLANTKLADTPQGQVQFIAAQEWVASKLGAHTLVVRAFNGAGASGESSLPIAVNPRIAGQGTPTAAPTDIPTDTPVAEVTDTTPIAPSDTPIADATTAVPTETPTTAPTNTPTKQPTLPPIVFLPPFDGGMNIATNWSELGLFIQANANDVAVGEDDGAGIAFVDIFIQNLKGAVIAQKRLTHPPYCYFGVESDDERVCHRVQPGTNEFVWFTGRPIQRGTFLVRAVAYTPDNRIQVAEQPVQITIPVNDLEDLFVDYERPLTDRMSLSDTLEYQASVSGQDVDDETGAGIDRVEMFVVDYNGKIVNAQTERQPFYCGFGDGGLKTPCNVYDFDDHNLKWANGDSVNPTQYLLRSIVYAKDGRIAARSSMIQIDQ